VARPSLEEDGWTRNSPEACARRTSASPAAAIASQLLHSGSLVTAQLAARASVSPRYIATWPMSASSLDPHASPSWPHSSSTWSGEKIVPDGRSVEVIRRNGAPSFGYLRPFRLHLTHGVTSYPDSGCVNTVHPQTQVF
jgi:hypothetical protein